MSNSRHVLIFSPCINIFPHVLIKEEEEKLLDDKLLELESQKESKVAAWQAEDQKFKELDVKFTHVLIMSPCINIPPPPPCINKGRRREIVG